MFALLGKHLLLYSFRPQGAAGELPRILVAFGAKDLHLHRNIFIILKIRSPDKT